MPIVPTYWIHQERIAKAVAEAERELLPDVVHIRYSFGEDWSGSNAIFFRVLLSDQASTRAGLREVARRVSDTVLDRVQPDELGLQAYFNFRAAYEQAQLNDEAWA